MADGSRPRRVGVASNAILILLFASCGPRAARPTSADEQHGAADAAAPPISTDAAVTPGVTETASGSSDPAPEPPHETLPWVNPSRCLTPCTYDPQASLVRVDKDGAVDPAGSQLVDRTIQAPLRKLVAAAHAAGHKVRIESAFRSYADQARLKHRITGYRPEPWHVRFVGVPLASEMRSSGLTLEELFRARPTLGDSGNCGDCPQAMSRVACGDIDAAGRCDGTVLQWCYDDALASVDCAAFKQRCGRARGSNVYDCLAK